MALIAKNPTETKAWAQLQAHFEKIETAEMLTWFKQDPKRVEQLSLEWEDFYLDFSKNRIDEKTVELLLDLAHEMQLEQAIQAQFNGEKINQTENRAVWHTALRAAEKPKEVQQNLEQIKIFSEKLITGEKKGYSGKAFTDIVNIGIGGSDLGPKMVVEALQYYKNHLQTHFISNIDSDHTAELFKKINPETTLFIVVSKSFGTQETLVNASTIRSWFVEQASQEAVEHHFVAVSSNLKAVQDFGILPENTFPMWDWVGGRFSLWSSVGLSIACALGYKNFTDLLAGAQKMDSHFSQAPFRQNIPVLMGLISVWYNNFFKTETEAVVPYSTYLEKLIPYLQQAVMESNGKQTDRFGEPVNYQTGTIVWGAVGSNAQHAFFQLLHQGTKLIPLDLIGFKKPLHPNKEHHGILMANFFAQSQALLTGKSAEEVEKEIAGFTPDLKKRQAAYKLFKGNKPSTSILINKLTPSSMGKLLAMYEHKIFVQGVIWNIFSYDQWGVELGKQLAKKIIPQLKEKEINQQLDASTQKLLKEFLS
ncbi:glucose-6-phosphate isomerase [uncultured Mesonia sp.]|uniref:glucose-6-phosphate isomerase n=1 Tax=uncultured Mesonia sp. TaxID=399731 RepID=UPI00374FB41A